MPTYDYACKECGHQFEAFQAMKDSLLTECPSCGTEALQRMIGAGAGLLFKGSGYYQTDYKKSSSSPTSSSGSTTNGDASEKSATTESAPKTEAAASTKPTD
jgi:putative FmdB family regulatory protein